VTVTSCVIRLLQAAARTCVTYCVMENYHVPRTLAAFILFHVTCVDGVRALIYTKLAEL